MIALTDLLAIKVEEVLQTPLLRQALVSYTRTLFYGGSPVSSCDSSCRNYFRRLQLEGVEKQKNLITMKHQLKPGAVLVFNGQVYNSSTITDKIAEAYLKEFPKGEKNFVAPKVGPKAAAPAKPEGEKEKLLARAKELGIEGEGLSVKKLKEAIADKEIEIQKAAEEAEAIAKAADKE